MFESAPKTPNTQEDVFQNQESGRENTSKNIEWIKRKANTYSFLLFTAVSALVTTSCGMQQGIQQGGNPYYQTNRPAAAAAASAENAFINATRATSNINTTYNRTIVHQYQQNNAAAISNSAQAKQRLQQRRAGQQ